MAVVRRDGLSLTAFALGLLGLVASVGWLWWFWFFVIAPFATVLAIAVGDTARRRERSVAGRRVALAAVVLGGVGLAVWVLCLLILAWVASSIDGLDL